MIKIREMETEHGRLKYELHDDHVVVSEYRGKDVTLTIPVNLEEKPVTVIGKKAFLGTKSLRELVLPECINTIQDWAFASCSNLEIITFPQKTLTIGQGILKDCFRLEQVIAVYEDATGIEDGVSYLLAAAMNKLEAFYLFDLMAAGSSAWLEQWDARMLLLLEQADTEGFSKMLLCGEEDYGSKENHLDYYVEQRRRFKVRLAILRLMHDVGLKTSVRETLMAYLQAHKKGESSEETWKVVLEEHGDDKRYYQFLLDHECINEENFDLVLGDMGEFHTEMKAFLMNWWGKMTERDKKDAFGMLELEW